MQPLRFDNRFLRELPGDAETAPYPRQVQRACWSRVMPTPVAAPQLIACSPQVAELVGLSAQDLTTRDFADVFGGNALMPGMDPYAACYGGHQFGHWAGQLGDGRAIVLGETINARGERWELQLKGAGRTAYSRGADGRAVLRSSLREFLCSEAMFHLGVPTTRALSLVLTGDQVARDMFYDGHAALEPGAIVCRVSPSFIRFGNFEIFAARGDVETLAKLVDFTIARDFPAIAALDLPQEQKRLRMFEAVCESTARLMVHWMRVGFVHGVMNTDNMSILGLTIDYGPYGFLDDFDPSWTPNTTDREQRRYRFGRQPDVALWNLAALAQALAPLFDTHEPLEATLERYTQLYTDEAPKMLAQKLGLTRRDDGQGNNDDDALVRDLLSLMQRAELDMTLCFRALADVDLHAPSIAPLTDAFYRNALRVQHEAELTAWLQRYAARALTEDVSAEQRRARMNAINPKYLLRNYIAQEAIDLATAGDYSRIHTLLDVLQRPYDEQPEHSVFAHKRPDWARHKAGCSMLSCSS